MALLQIVILSGISICLEFCFSLTGDRSLLFPPFDGLFLLIGAVFCLEAIDIGELGWS